MTNTFPKAPEPSHFRLWVNNIWMHNRDEHQELREPVLSITEYWNNYKWWLKREYRYQRRQGNV